MATQPTASKLSPAQRASLFAQATRQYVQKQPALIFAENQSVSFQLPKARFGSKLVLKVAGVFTASHATKTVFAKKNFDKYRLLRQIKVSANNSFSPYQVAGFELRLLNLINEFAGKVADPFGLDALGTVVSVGGAVNTVKFNLELPLTLNDRDSVGLWMLQDGQSVVSLDLDFGSIKDMMVDTDINISGINITVTPYLETFSIPPIADAIPDYSVIKVVNSQIKPVSGNGDTVINLPVGLTYRKLIFFIATDDQLTPIAHSGVGDIQLMFNQADSPYVYDGDYLAIKNSTDYAGLLPLGAYVMDWSTQGLPNLGGGRDYIDTERLTQFDIKFNLSGLSGSANKIYVIAEKLAKLY